MTENGGLRALREKFRRQADDLERQLQMMESGDLSVRSNREDVTADYITRVRQALDELEKRLTKHTPSDEPADDRRQKRK
jgi:hypothetical protein